MVSLSEIYNYSIHDAIEAGFNHVVFIIRKDIEKEFKEAIGNRIAAICSSHNVTVDYLRRMPEKEAFKKVEAILDPKVTRLAGDDGAPMPVQSNVDGAKFAVFIDAAVADSIRELEKREDDLSKAGVTMLGNVDGKSMVEQMSPQFLEFVLDAYRSLKFRK